MSTALLVIDPNDDFIAEEGEIWPHIRDVAGRLQAVPNMKKLVSAARERTLQVVFVPHRQYQRGDLESWKFLARSSRPNRLSTDSRPAFCSARRTTPN